MIVVLFYALVSLAIAAVGLGILFAIADSKAAALYREKDVHPRRLELPRQDAGELMRERLITRYR